MRIALLLIVAALSIQAADYEHFKLKDGRTIDGEYVNGSIVMDGGAVSIPVAEADIVARGPAERPAKKDKPEKKPKPPEAPTPPVVSNDKEESSGNKELDARRDIAKQFIISGDLSPVTVPKDSPDADMAKLVNDRLATLREVRKTNAESHWLVRNDGNVASLASGTGAVEFWKAYCKLKGKDMPLNKKAEAPQEIKP